MSSEIALTSSVAILQLVSTADSIRSEYETVVHEWLPDAPPLTIVFSTIGRGLCCYAPRASGHDLSAIGKIIENIFVYGESPVKNAVATGLLEAVLGEASAGRFDMELLSKHFGPKTMDYCIEWDKFTGCQTKGIVS